MTAPGTRGVLATTLIATAVDMTGVLPVYLTGALAIQLQGSIGLEIQTLGVVVGSYFAAAALGSAPVGRLTERYDPGLFLRIGVGLYVAVFIGLAVMPGVGALIGLVVVAGIGTSLTRTASSLLVARGIPGGRQGLALGVRNCAIPAAALLSGLAVPGVALTVGWRWAYALAAVLSVGVLVAVPRSVPRPQVHAGRAERSVDMPVALLVAMAVAAALASTAAASLGAFTAVTAVDAGMSEAAAGVLIAAASLVGVASRMGVGWWTDRRPGSQLDVVVGKMLIGGVAYALIAFGEAPLLWLAVPVAYASGWAFYGSYYLSVIRLNPVAQGSAVGVAQSGAFAGSIIGPPVLGALASRVSFTAAWIAAAVAVSLAALLVLSVELRVRAPVGGLR